MKKLFFFLLLVGAGAGGGYFWWLQQKRTAQPLKPILEKLDRGEVIEKVAATGKVAPIEKILVSTDVPLGIVVQINPDAEQGKFISRGTWLLKLDDTLAQAGLKEAEANLKAAEAVKNTAEAAKTKAETAVDFAKEQVELAKRELEAAVSVGGDSLSGGRKRALESAVNAAERGHRVALAGVSEAESAIRAAEANILRAKAGINVANMRVELMTIAAPRDGVILEKRVLQGQPVSPQNSPLFIMTPSASDWEIYALVAEGDIARVLEGQTVEFTVDAYSSRNVKFHGKVTRKDRVPTQLTSQGPIGLGIVAPTYYGVAIKVFHDSQLDQRFPLMAGLTANVDIQVNSVKDALRVPNTALQYRPANLSREVQNEIDERAQHGWQPIWVWIDDRFAEMRYVKIGVNDGTYAEIKEIQGDAPLEAGAAVVIEDPLPEKSVGGLGLFGEDKPLEIPIR